jgi:hypothetical protein
MATNHLKKVNNPDLVRGRVDDTHIKRCNRGYGNSPKISYEYREVHHVLCVHSLTDATISALMQNDGTQLERIKDCLNLTKWNINDDHNTVGLPKKTAFYKYASSSGWGEWPCHQVDHNVNGGYTEEVSGFLKTNVWDTVEETSKGCKFKAKSFEQLLKDCSQFWYDFLESRGKEDGGTAYYWDNRFGIADGTKKAANKWYYPFSMHPNTPTPRKPPPDPKKASERLKQLLKAIK